MTLESPGAPPERFNATMRKFGAPETVVRDYRHWCVLLRPKQCTLGAVILACHEPVTALPDVSEAAFQELKQVTAEMETALAGAFRFDKINYLMLMMVDPDVHFHVLPRYADSRDFAGRAFADAGWPGPPELGQVTSTDAALNREIVQRIQACWP